MLVLIGVFLIHFNFNTKEILEYMAISILVLMRVVPSGNRFISILGGLSNNFIWIDELKKNYSQLQSISISNFKIYNFFPKDWSSLTFKNVSFVYPNESNFSLKNISFQIQRFKTYGFVGRSGSGKSTIIDLIAGFRKPSNGKIMLDDNNFYKISLRKWMSQIGYVSQSPFILDGTILENIVFGTEVKKIDTKLVIKALKLAGLMKDINFFPDKVNTYVGDRGLLLSGGQRQRIAIARAFYNNKKFIIFDEATSNLDGMTEKEIQDSILLLRNKVTFILIAHRLETLRFCDRIFYIEAGKLINEGTFSYLWQKFPKFKKLANINTNYLSK
jgi:ABC-type multidrug transport system fused ATPase/permease subunit